MVYMLTANLLSFLVFQNNSNSVWYVIVRADSAYSHMYRGTQTECRKILWKKKHKKSQIRYIGIEMANEAKIQKIVIINRILFFINTHIIWEYIHNWTGRFTLFWMSILVHFFFGLYYNIFTANCRGTKKSMWTHLWTKCVRTPQTEFTDDRSQLFWIILDYFKSVYNILSKNPFRIIRKNTLLYLWSGNTTNKVYFCLQKSIYWTCD